MISNNRPAKKSISATRLAVQLVIVILICLAVSSLANSLRLTWFESSTSNKMKQFVLEEYKIEFTYPENWVAYRTPQGNHGDLEVVAFLTARGTTFQNLTIAHKNFQSNDVSEVADWGTSRIETRFIDFEPQTLTSYSSEDLSGLISEYVANTNSPLETENAHCKDLFFLIEQNGFAFSLCADESDWIDVSPIFNRIIESIQVVE